MQGGSESGPVNRRLSAILAADVAGYSRLIAADETGTLDSFRRIRADIIDPAVAKFQGRLVGSAGDSLLIEFTNALAAVECALACQQGVGELNASLADEKRIQFRMAVNLGDVIPADGTIHGDGVNVASRLEKLASPGGIAVSRSVFEQVENKLPVGFVDIGDHQVKNIAKPIRVYRADIAGRTPSRPGARTATEKVSIAVLPFDNLSDDPEQAYFSDGLAEDIITELSKFREFLVIARNSSFQFRGKTGDLRDVAGKLGCQFIVEGSVRKIGNRVRISAQLIDVAANSHAWAEKYDRELTDIFAIQDEITQMIVSRLARHTRTAIIYHGRAKPTANLSAFDHFLRAQQVMGRYDTHLQAEQMLMNALEIDPDFAAAQGLLAITEVNKYFRKPDRAMLARAHELASRAILLDPNESLGHCAMGFALMFMHRYAEAEPHFVQAASLNPNDVFTRAIWALLKCFSGRHDDAFRDIEDMLRRDPYANDWLWDIRGTIESHVGRYRDALESFGKMQSPAVWSLCYVLLCQVELAQTDAARATLARIRAEIGDRTPEQIFAEDAANNPLLMQRFRDALRAAEE